MKKEAWSGQTSFMRNFKSRRMDSTVSKGEADDVADVRGNFLNAVGLNELAVFADLILFFSGSGEVAGIHALHADGRR